MKQKIKLATYVVALLTLSLTSCIKDKKEPDPEPAPVNPPENDPEVITSLKIYMWDSITNTPITGSPFSFKDPDGDGGQAGGFLNNGADSVIVLNANTTYKTRVVILDETKKPVDSTSNEVGGGESYEHMFFYNGDPSQNNNSNGNAIINSAYPNYTVKLNGSNIRIRYTDTDNGAVNGKPIRNIGLETYLKTDAAFSGKYPFITTLKHQPGEKDGTYAPGESDVSIAFKIKVI